MKLNLLRCSMINMEVSRENHRGCCLPSHDLSKGQDNLHVSEIPPATGSEGRLLHVEKTVIKTSVLLFHTGIKGQISHIGTEISQSRRGSGVRLSVSSTGHSW